MPIKPTKNNDGNRRRERGDQTRVNERIRAPRVRVVTANGDQLGVMNTRDALEKAKALGLDLVEVAGNADPPVCRVVDYGRYKYQQSKLQKNNKSRTITPAPYVMKLLQAQKVQQARQRLMAGPAWEDSGLVFTNEFGRYVSYRAIFDSFKRIVKRIGLPDARIHDLRHTYAVNCIRAGDDIKTVQSNLGHATAAFTLDVYGHFTDDMRSVSAQRMEGFITNVLDL